MHHLEGLEGLEGLRVLIVSLVSPHLQLARIIRTRVILAMPVSIVVRPEQLLVLSA